MKIQTITKIAAVAILILSLTSCDDSDDISVICDVCDDAPIIDDEEISLVGTSWKLVGVVDVTTETLNNIVPDEVECEGCYTLTFHTDTTFSNYSAMSRGTGNYSANYLSQTIFITNYTIDLFHESGYGNSWMAVFSDLENFLFREDELRLCYNENRSCLLFRPYQQNTVDPPNSWFDMSLQPENLEKTIWQLIEVSIIKEGHLFEHIEPSEENIVYDFQEGDKLIISGNTAYLSVFDSVGLPISDFFRNGEHVYNYRKLEECPTCYPGPDPNLIIDNRDDPWAWHYCLVSLDNRRMEITGGALINIGVSVDNLVFYQWIKTFMLLSD